MFWRIVVSFIHLFIFSHILEIFIKYLLCSPYWDTVHKTIGNSSTLWNLHSLEGETEKWKYKQVKHVAY